MGKCCILYYKILGADCDTDHYVEATKFTNLILLSLLSRCMLQLSSMETYFRRYEGQSISNVSYFFFLLYFSRKLKYNYIA